MFLTVNCNLRIRYKINGPSHRLWMYRRIYKDTGELRDEFINGVEDFDKLHALSKSLWSIRCIDVPVQNVKILSTPLLIL